MNSLNDDDFYRLSAMDLCNINAAVTQRKPFVRDYQVLRSAVQRPYITLFGEAQFPTVIDKAAATMHSLAAHHIFTDGNKRTAEVATTMYLKAHNIQPTWTDDAVAAFLLQIAQHECTVEDVAAWLHDHTAISTS